MKNGDRFTCEIKLLEGSKVWRRLGKPDQVDADFAV
jgi:hypothetical protein